MGIIKNKNPNEVQKERHQLEQKKRDVQVLTLFVILAVMTLVALFALQGLLPTPLLNWTQFKASF